jgi:hypothetical protein
LHLHLTFLRIFPFIQCPSGSDPNRRVPTNFFSDDLNRRN